MSIKINIMDAYYSSSNTFRYDTNTLTSLYLEKFALSFPY